MSDLALLTAFIIGLIVLCFITKLLSLPLRTLLRLVYNSIIGAVCLWVIDYVLGLNIPINFVTALIAGTLGVPGVLLIIIYYLLK